MHQPRVTKAVALEKAEVVTVAWMLVGSGSCGTVEVSSAPRRMKENRRELKNVGVATGLGGNAGMTAVNGGVGGGGTGLFAAVTSTIAWQRGPSTLACTARACMHVVGGGVETGC